MFVSEFRIPARPSWNDKISRHKKGRAMRIPRTAPRSGRGRAGPLDQIRWAGKGFGYLIAKWNLKDILDLSRSLRDSYPPSQMLVPSIRARSKDSSDAQIDAEIDH